MSNGQVLAAEGALRAAAESTSEAQRDLEQILARLDGQMRNIQSLWTGAGGTAFQTVMLRWNESSTKVVRALENFRANLVESQTSHEQTDTAQEEALNAIAARLG